MRLKYIALLPLLMTVEIAQAKVVSDRLVNNLSCKSITVDSIYKAVRSDAYDRMGHLPYTNWAFGVLANCWSLSRAQRLVTMLARDTQTPDLSQKNVESMLNLIRNSAPTVDMDNSSQIVMKERYLRSYSVFKTDQASSFGRSKLLQAMHVGFPIEGGHERSFRREVEAFQVYRFHKAGNLKMGLGSWERSQSENEQTYKTMVKNANGKRLTLINLRAEQLSQHIVMVKRYEKRGSDTIFTVYDSNQPSYEEQVVYNDVDKQFYAQGIMYTNKALGVFVVDEDEREKIDDALVSYYKSICK